MSVPIYCMYQLVFCVFQGTNPTQHVPSLETTCKHLFKCRYAPFLSCDKAGEDKGACVQFELIIQPAIFFYI